jgi:thiamine-monophosphate kinase
VERTVRTEAVALGRGREFDRIRALLAHAQATGSAEVVVGPGDDCAVLAGGLVLSTDLSVEGVHFRRTWIEADEIGDRAVTVALSDLAAMAAEPLGVLVSLGLSKSEPQATVESLGEGIGRACDRVGAVLLGGDLTAAQAGLIIDVTAVGKATAPVLRSGARPGDELWVTGVLGGSGGAVRAWESGQEPTKGLRERFVRPVARVREAAWLRERVGLRALIDLSDGLRGDAGHLAAASGVRVTLDTWEIPVHEDAIALFGREEALNLALGAGEDYELCLAASPGSVAPVAGAFHDALGTRLTRVGTVGEGNGVYLRFGPDEPAEPAAGGGYDHFDAEAGA